MLHATPPSKPPFAARRSPVMQAATLYMLRDRIRAVSIYRIREDVAGRP